MKNLKIKIHEIMKMLDSDIYDMYVFPDSSKPYTVKSLKKFLETSISAHSACQIFFSRHDYGFSVIDKPVITAKFANIFLMNSNVAMPILNIEPLCNESLLKYFPIEWIKEHIIEDNKKSMVLDYNYEELDFYLRQRNEDDFSNLSTNLKSLELAIEYKRLQEVYDLYINQEGV